MKTAVNQEIESGPSRRSGLLLVSGLFLASIVLLVVAAGQSRAPDDLSVVAAVALGLVEGLTEYLPVSSTGHLLVANRIAGLGGTVESDLALDTYAICIQLGAILAVVVLYWRRLIQMLHGLTGRDEEGKRILIACVAAFVPTVIIALLVKDFVKENLFGPTPIAASWLVGGIGVLVMTRVGLLRRGTIELKDITLRQAVIIGVAQSLAMWPGTSRSLITIVAASLVGLSLAAAVEFSFLLGLATLSAATLFEGATNGGNLISTFGYLTPAIGLVVAFLSAAAAVKWMVAWLQDQGFAVFGWYRIAIGVAALTAISAGSL